MAMESLTSWTDDIPICQLAGIGSANNEIYRKDGRRVEMHPMQDRYFHFSQEEYDLSLYGLFDGFNGPEVADFCQQRMPAELLLGQLSAAADADADAVRHVLRQGFVNVEREYFESVMESIAKRIVMKSDPKVRPDDPRLRRLDSQAEIGASATLALVLGQKLYVANAGDTRAVVCSMNHEKDGGQTLKVIKLSVDHVLGNEDEELRLKMLGVDPSAIESELSATGGYTRCLGLHKVKGGYQEVEALQTARDEPVLCDPEIHGGLDIETNFQFLLLFSRSLTDCLSQVISLDEGLDATDALCQITLEQFTENATVSGVAQSVVDKVVRMHRDQLASAASPASASCTQREDITLLVRQFGAKLAPSSSSSGGGGSGRRKRSSSSTAAATQQPDGTLKPAATLLMPTTLQSSTTTGSSDLFVEPQRRPLPLDEQGRIEPYVDFGHFNREWAKYEAEQQQQQQQ